MLLPALQEDRVQEVSCIFQLWCKPDAYIPRTDSLIDKLILYAVNRGGLTA